MKKYVVLLSSGLDSAVNLYASHQEENSSVALALTFDYGQRAAQKEIECAGKLCEKLNIPHHILQLPFFRNFGKSSLVDASLPLPQGSDVSIDDLRTSEKTAKSVWVPNRNGIFLNIAAGFAESLGADAVVPGFNREEAATFPDNSKAFLQAMTASLQFSTSIHVKVECFTTDMVKTEIVKWGVQLGVDWSLLWPCYQNLSKWCGECESCQRARRAFKSAGIDNEKLFLKN